MYNKKLLSKIDLGKFKKPNPYSKDIITDPAGQYNHPGKPTRIPSSNITMKGVGYPVLGVADNGQQQLMQPGQDYIFPGAKYVDEFPQMKKGGGLNSKKYTRSLEGIGSLFRESDLFKKPKSKKKKFFHPNAKYFQDGGEPGDKFKKRLMKRYPGMQDVYGAEGENLSIVKDPNYDARSVGYGDIEFQFPEGNPEIRYDNLIEENGPEYIYPNPSPNTYLALYNPRGANRGDVFLDMMHGMRDDPNYLPLLQNFEKAVRDARGEDMTWEYEGQVKNGSTQSRDRFDENYIDGQLRAQLAPGSIGMFSKGRKDYRIERKYDSPEMRAAAEDIRNYLKGKPTEEEYQEGGITDPKNPNLTKEQKEYLRIKRAEAKKVYDAAKAGDPNAKKLAADFKVKYPGESWTCPSDNCPSPSEFKPVTTKPKVNQYPTDYKPVVNNIPQTPPEGKALVGYEEVQQLDPKTGIVTTVKNPVYKDLEQPIPTLHPTRVNTELKKFVYPETETEGTDVMPVYDETDIEVETPGPGGHWEDKTSRYIDWDGNRIPYRLPRFRKPGHYGPLVKKGKKHYIPFPSIEKRYDAWIEPDQLPEEEYKQGGAASPKDLDPETMRRYLAALKNQENDAKAGYKGGKWYPHKSPEGGLDTIAYGHKLTSRNSPYYQGITDQQAEQLLQSDVLKHQAIAKKQVDAKYGKGTFDSLPQDRQMLLVDYQYNLGTLSGFPSFVDATVKGDKEKMLKEHVRYGAGKPLKRRNDWTVGVINEMTFPEKYDPNQIDIPIANVPDATTVVNQVDPAAMPAPTPVELPPNKFQDGGIVTLNGKQYRNIGDKWYTVEGVPVNDQALAQKLKYEGKPLTTTVQEAPGRAKAKETIVNASKQVKPQPITKQVSRANVADATSVEQPYIQKPSFLDQPSPAQSFKDVEKARREYAQLLLNQGLGKSLGVTAKYLSPANANSANPKTLEQLMLEEIDKKGFEQKLKNAQMSGINKKWNEASTYQKASDVTRSFLADPINVTEEFIWGDQYLPDRANILRDPRNPLNPLYRKETGYDQSPINNMVNMINPFSSAADATVYARQGNLLGTATQFGEGLLKAVALSRAPGLINSAMARKVNLGALGVTDLGTIAGGVGVGTGTLALPTTAEALYKAGRTGKKEDWRAAVNQTLLNATDFIAPEVLGSKGALSALVKGEKLTPLQQLSRQNIITGSLSTPGLDNLSELRNGLRRASQESEFPITYQGTLPSSSSASNIDDILNRVQQIRLEPAPRSTYRPESRLLVQTDGELQDALTAANQRIATLPKDSEERRMYEVFASEIRSNIDARINYTNALNKLEQARRNHAAAGLEETNDLVMQAQADLAMAKENLKIADPDYLKIDQNSRNLLNQERQRLLSTPFDLTRQTPGVTTYDATNLPAAPRANLFEGALSNYNITTEPIEFSEATRTALNSRPPRERGSGSLMTYGAQLRAASDPIEFANRLRNMLASGAIDVKAYQEITKNFKNILGKKSDATDLFEFESAKMILGTDPKKIYTGSTLSRNEALNELKAIPEDEMNNILQQNYGYTLDDVEFIFTNPNTPENVAKIAMNQILDDYEYVTKYGTLNPNAPAINFTSREIVAPQLKSTLNEIDMLGLSDKAAETIKKTSYKGDQNLTSGTVSYSGTERADLPKINNKDYIVTNNDLNEQLDAYEEAFAKLQNNRGPVYNDIRNRVEDLRATKWLRTEYAAELRAAGLDPKEIDKITVITTGRDSKSLVNADGDVIGTLNFGSNTYNGTRFSEISSTGVNLKFHGYNLKRSKFKTWEDAEKHLAKRYLDEDLATITNPSDRNNPIVIKSLTKKANDRAAAEIAQIQINNNNRFGEALYRGVHHGIKDTRGGIGTKEHFVDTSLPDPITGERITRKRAQDYWYSQIKQINDQGVGKAGRAFGPLTENDAAWGVNSPIFILRKLGGDVSKLSRFIG